MTNQEKAILLAGMWGKAVNGHVSISDLYSGGISMVVCLYEFTSSIYFPLCAVIF